MTYAVRLMLSCACLWLLPGVLVNEIEAKSDKAMVQIGIARVDITPTHPIRLCGYASRKTEATDSLQRLWAKAMVIDDGESGPALLMTVDNCAVPGALRQEVLDRLKNKTELTSERFALCSTHTHTGPYLSGSIPNMFGYELPKDQMDRVERYTRTLVDNMEKAALMAWENRQPARLSWSQGKAGFAKNRRVEDGPVDHDLPLLTAKSTDGKLLSILISYACHCTTLTGQFNQFSGDWAGFAAQYIEENHPETIVLTALGCGGDSNPTPRSELHLVKQYGKEIADEVEQLIKKSLKPVDGQLTCRAEQIHLPFESIPSHSLWEAWAKKDDAEGFRAKKNLARLERGETIPSALPYLVQTWTFGNDLTMVNLPGEVVVDYSLRLKKELTDQNVWVNAYTNDVPCYIPSKRILQVGGYEAESSMIYYDQPTKLKPETEDLIVNTVHGLLADS